MTEAERKLQVYLNAFVSVADPQWTIIMEKVNAAVGDAVSEEREACAQLADKEAASVGSITAADCGYSDGCVALAAAIRARGSVGAEQNGLT